MPTGIYVRTKEYKEKLRQKMLSNPVKYWLGKNISTEHRNKIGLKLLGRKHTEEHKAKLSTATKNRMIGTMGSSSPAWKGGAIDWAKREALKRDDYTCQNCGLHEPEIVQVDHIVPRYIRPDLASDMSNLKVLCPTCHARKTNQDRKTYKFMGPKK